MYGNFRKFYRRKLSHFFTKNVENFAISATGDGVWTNKAIRKGFGLCRVTWATQKQEISEGGSCRSLPTREGNVAGRMILRPTKRQ